MHTEILQIIFPLILMVASGLVWWRLRLKRLKRYISPKLDNIDVYRKYNGERFLTINSYAQGVSINKPSIKKSYWYSVASSAIRLTRGKKPPQILMLGLGANTISNLIAKINSKVHQVIVEFDEDIIKACKDYFDLDKLPNFEIIHTDAYKLLDQKQAFKQKFDCIIVDIFTGNPPYVSLASNKPTFINKLLPYLKQDGSLIFNRPGHTDEARADSQRLEKDLKLLFKETKILDIKDPRGYRNNVIIGSSQKYSQ